MFDVNAQLKTDAFSAMSHFLQTYICFYWENAMSHHSYIS